MWWLAPSIRSSLVFGLWQKYCNTHGSPVICRLCRKSVVHAVGQNALHEDFTMVSQYCHEGDLYREIRKGVNCRADWESMPPAVGRQASAGSERLCYGEVNPVRQTLPCSGNCAACNKLDAFCRQRDRSRGRQAMKCGNSNW